MKVIRFLFICIFCLLIATSTQAATQMFGRTALIGGTASVDNITAMVDGDLCIVIDSSKVLYFYLYDDDNTDTETSPEVIEPDSGSGAWELITSFRVGSSTAPTIVFRDSDGAGTADGDKDAAWIKVNMGTTTEDSEDADIWVEVVQGGAENTEVLRFDESDDQWEFKTHTTVEGVGGTGGLTDYDLSVGDTDGTPTYGVIRAGDSTFGRSSYAGGSLDIGGATMINNQGALDAGNDPGIEFLLVEGGDTIRLAVPESGAGNATAMIRSVTIAGPMTLNNNVVTGDTWSTYDSNLDFDTGGSGADLFVQDDLEVEGEIFLHGSIYADADDASQHQMTWASASDDRVFTFPDDQIADLDMIVGTGAGTFGYVAMGGEATLANDGTLTIADTVTVDAWTLTGVPSLTFAGADANPNAAGEIQYDNTITGILSGGALRWYDNDSVRVLVDLETDPVDGDDDYVVAYDSTADGFYMKADSTGSALGSNLTSSTNDIVSDNNSIELESNSEDIDFEFTANTVTLTSDTDVDTFDFGIINLASDALDLSGGSITNLAVGGLPDNVVDNGSMADNAIDNAELADDAVTMAELDEDGNFVDWTGNWTFGTGTITLGDGFTDGTMTLDGSGGYTGVATIAMTGALSPEGAINLGTGGVIFTDDGDGQLTITGAGDGSDENLTINFDDTADTVVIDTSTSVGEIDFSAINLVTTGTISGEISVTADTAATVTLTAADCRGAMRLNGDDDFIDYTLPTAEAGLNVCIYQRFVRVITIDVDNTSDRIVLDGTELTLGYSIDSPGTIGDFICLLAIDATNWITLGRSGDWVDGGAD